MLFLGLKHLLTRKKQTIVTLLGIIIGTTAFIVISCFFRGIQEFITDSLVSGDAHIKIQARERVIDKAEVQSFLFPEYNHFNWLRKPAGKRAASSIENPLGWFERFDKYPDVVASTSVYTTTALINNNHTVYSLSITGTKPAEEVKITNIQTKMTHGNFLDLSKGTSRIIIGDELANNLAKQVGDSITLVATDGRQVPYKIVGTFSTGNKRSDLSAAYMSLTDAQKLAGVSGVISQISVKVKNFREASTLSNTWKKISYDKVESWDQSNENLMSMFQSQDMTRYMATGIIMLVAAFGIYNILNMVVTQKRKDIAILRSMGYEAYDIVTLFLIQGLILGLSGGVLGCLLGYIIGISIGTVHFGPPGSSGSGFQMTFNFTIYFSAMMISNCVALAASFFPAYSASKLTPIEIIRSGAE